jgi:hypothetical protein
MQSLDHRIGFEIVGNNDHVRFQLAAHAQDHPRVRAGFEGAFECCRVVPATEDTPLMPATDQHGAWFYDFFVDPPYWHRVTASSELHLSPLATVIHELTRLPQQAVGLYQVLFAPVSDTHPWHQHIRTLADIEYMSQLAPGGAGQRNPQQTPSGDLRHSAEDVATKADDNLPLFACAVRLAVFGRLPNPRAQLDAMASFSGVIQHQGRPLLRLSDRDYRHYLSSGDLHRLLHNGTAYRHGFLVNASELASFAHLPKGEVRQPSQLNVHRSASMTALESLPTTQTSAEGCYLGDNYYAGQRRPVYLPNHLRFQHCNTIGQTGAGKSTLIQQMALDDLRRGDGVAILDPHSELVHGVLGRLDSKYFDRVVYLSWSDPSSIPVWNPLLEQDVSRSRLVMDIISALRTLMTGSGDRLEHLLRMSLLGLLHLDRPTLLDCADALRPKSKEAKRLRDEVLKRVPEGRVRQFWEEDLPRRYTASDLAPAQHKLSNLVSGEGPLSATLSQRNSRINLRRLMDHQAILLVDLSGLGGELQTIAGSLLMSALNAAAVSRADQLADERRPFHIHVDEAARFAPENFESLTAEARKYAVSLNLCHQRFAQFTTRQAQGLRGVGTTLAFKVSTDDAEVLVRGLEDRVDKHDLIRLRRGEVIANIGGNICRFHVPPPPAPGQPGSREAIIARSRETYYRRLTEATTSETHPETGSTARAAPHTDSAQLRQDLTEFHYDEF